MSSKFNSQSKYWDNWEVKKKLTLHQENASFKGIFKKNLIHIKNKKIESLVVICLLLFGGKNYLAMFLFSCKS